ncbi:hypothetical protein EsH8_VIII_000569 [Colletotrichum jinshuiense]
MQIQSVVATIALAAASASAAYVVPGPIHPPGYNGTGTFTVTKVWDRVTTYCPEPTTLYFNNRTYVIDKPKTFVIPDCPCTQTYTTYQSEGDKPTAPVPASPPIQTPAAGYGTYQNYQPGQPGQPAQSANPGVSAPTGAPGGGNGSKPPVVAAGAPENRAVLGVAAVAAAAAVAALVL